MTATHAHGTRATYQAGCRCLPCRSAAAAYRPAAPRLDATPARLHLGALASAGVGTRAVARASGLARSLLCAVRAGRVTRLRADSIALILSVEAPDLQRTVPAGPSWVLVQRITLEGYTHADIARRLGLQDARLRWGQRRRVRPDTEDRLRALLHEVTAEGM